MPIGNKQNLASITKPFKTGQDVRQTGEQNKIRSTSPPSPRIVPNTVSNSYIVGSYTEWPTKEERHDVLQMLKKLATPFSCSRKKNYNVSGDAIWVPLSERGGKENIKMLRDWMRNIRNLLEKEKLEVSDNPYLRVSELRSEVVKMLDVLAANDKSFHLENQHIRIEVNEFPLEILQKLASATHKFLSSSEASNPS